MPSSLITHSRYFHAPRLLGTRPRAKTVRRLEAQNALGLTPLRKLAVLETGFIQHPTKRGHTKRWGKFEGLKQSVYRGRGRIFAYTQYTGYKAKHRFSEAQQIIQKLTNHERKKLYSLSAGGRISEIPVHTLRAVFDPDGTRFTTVIPD
jgi:hypothetical protein